LTANQANKTRRFAGKRRRGAAEHATRKDPTRAIVLHPVLRDPSVSTTQRSAVQTAALANADLMPPDARLEEAVGLAQAIDLDVVQSGAVRLARPRPSTLLGPGKVEELRGVVEAEGAGLVIIDHALTPVQQRNLERAWNAKILDRTGLILEIFGARARTKEGRLQVELAHLLYQRSRLVRSWTHLERQRGGYGFLGGPGETQIEADRRIIGERMDAIRQELASARRTRKLHRDNRQRTPFPTVALAGYTNAGKSSLFNVMAKASVHAEDQLFATLDPTMRKLELPSGTAILSDTVGFISELPTTLVAAFRATLEEVAEADLILHVRDVATAFSERQKQEVEVVLTELGVDTDRHDRKILEVWNKIDLLSAEERAAIAAQAARQDKAPVLVSARSGEGIDELKARISQALSKDHVIQTFDLTSNDGALIHWLYRHGDVRSRQDYEDGRTRIEARLTGADLQRFEHMRTES